MCGLVFLNTIDIDIDIGIDIDIDMGIDIDMDMSRDMGMMSMDIGPFCILYNNLCSCLMLRIKGYGRSTINNVANAILTSFSQFINS